MKSIVVKSPCKVEKFDLDVMLRKNKNSIEILEGSFIRVYQNFLLFKTERGHRECFTKRTYGIDWTILKK